MWLFLLLPLLLLLLLLLLLQWVDVDVSSVERRGTLKGNADVADRRGRGKKEDAHNARPPSMGL